MEWAALYPDFVERHSRDRSRVLSPYVIERRDVWALPIRLDPKLNNSDHYGKDQLAVGVAQANSLCGT